MELTIGYHLLEGKMVDLKKPYAILEKQGGAATCDGDDRMEEDGAEPSGSVEYKAWAASPLHSWRPSACQNAVACMLGQVSREGVHAGAGDRRHPQEVPV